MAEFDVGLNGAQQQVAALVSAVHGLGKSLDQTEFKSKNLATEVARAMSAMDLVYDRLHRSMTKAGDDTNEVNKALEHAKIIAQNVFSSVAAANLKATVQAQAYTGSLTELQRVLNDTQSKNTYTKWQQKSSQLTNNLIGENNHLQQVIASLQTEEGRRNVTLKTQAAGLRDLVAAEDRLINAHNSLTMASGLLDTALGRETANLRVQNAAKERLITLDTRIQANSDALRASIANLSTEEGRQNAILKVQEQSKRSLLTADARLTASNSSLLQSISALDGHLGKLNAQLKVSLQGKTAEVTADARLANSTQSLYTKLEQLNTAKGHENVLTQQAVATRKSEITEAARLEAKLAALQREYMSLNGGVQEQIAKMQQLIQARKAGITEGAREETQIERLRRTLASLTGGRQEEITKLNAEIAVRRKAITDVVKQKTVVDEQAAALAREQAQLQKLQQQMSLASSARGAEITKLKLQIIEQERYNKLLNKTTLELLGFESAQRKVTASNLVGSQSAAMLRAGLSGLQTNIGMYTSATILAASSTYALARALRSTVELGSEFTASMAKADAVMGTGMASWMPTDMGAMEAQVRALGQSTMYTASEVALGLVELGQAGLSSADSIMALKPALNLAMIGSISMAQSADMATNVMMTFGMQAKDLTDIVDLMATAASQSNTNVEQLANALTYAGPAAHTAGISLKDTTAAVEALSNTGIKASRAGTGLRKLFVSLLNPTKKGKAMMDEYGISVADMEGKTRSLTDILGQLHNALKDVGEGERLSAIQDLVGLYATSSVAALVEQSGDGGNLQQLRRQLDDTAGAAEEMRAKMENSLKFDWKQVISAFEEAQLQLFDAHEYQLREATAKLSLYLIELTKPAAEIKDQYGNVTASFSELDLMLQHGKEMAEGLGYALGAALAFRVSKNLSTSMAALATDGGAAADRLKILAQRMAEGQRTTISLSGSMTTLRTSAASAMASVRALHAQVGLLGTVAVGTARALSGLARAANVMFSALGWVGLVYGIGSAIYAAFGQDSQEEILKQQAGVKDLKSSYDSLKTAIDATAKARERAALQKQIDNELEKLGTINERRYLVEGSIEGYTKENMAVPQALTNELFDIESAAQRAGKAIQDASREMDKLDDPNRRGKAADEAIANEERLAELRKNVATAEQNYHDAAGRMRLKEKDAWDAAQQALDSFKESLVVVTQQSDLAATQAAQAISLMSRLRDEQQSALAAHAWDKNATNGMKMVQNARDIAQAEADLKTAIDNGQGDVAERASKRLTGLQIEQMDLQKSARDTAATLRDTTESIADLSRTDADRLARAKDALAKLVDPKNKITYGSQALQDEGDLANAKQELKLRQEIKQIETSLAAQAKKDSRTPGKTQDVKDLEAAQKAFDELQKKSDPLAASLANVAKKTEQLDLLLAKGKITAADRAKVLEQLRKEHIQLTLEQDKNYQSLIKLKESYGDNPFSATNKDLAEMGRLLEAGTMSLTRYTQMYDAFQKKQKAKVLEGLPTGKDLNISSGQSGFNPFGEFINTANEVGQGDAAYAKRGTELGTGLSTALMNQDDVLQAQLEAQRQLEEQMSAQEHAAAMQKIVQDDFNTRKALQQQYNTDSQTLATARQEFAAQSEMMLAASMAGSMSDIFGQFAAVGEEATNAQKLAFIAQKALAVAQILLYTHVAAARAPAEAGPIFGIPLGELILAQGYASAALVGALAVGQLSSGGSSSGGSTQMYDTGGTIPYNRVGIVGEYGPELVSGPAHVTGRGASAAKLNSSDSGGGGMSVTLAPVFNVGSDQVGDTKDPTMLSKIFGTLFMKYISDALRPNGLLDNWYRSKRGG